MLKQRNFTFTFDSLLVQAHNKMAALATKWRRQKCVLTKMMRHIYIETACRILSFLFLKFYLTIVRRCMVNIPRSKSFLRSSEEWDLGENLHEIKFIPKILAVFPRKTFWKFLEENILNRIESKRGKSQSHDLNWLFYLKKFQN
jgi:hypothetical protein